MSQFSTNRLRAGSFSTIQTPAGSSPTATGPLDTLTLTSSDGSVSITGNALTDTIDFKVSPTFSVVSSVNCTDGTLVISPNTGAVIAARAAITGDVSVPAGSNVATLAASGATAGTYEILGGTVDAAGRLTTAVERKPTVIAMALIFG